MLCVSDAVRRVCEDGGGTARRSAYLVDASMLGGTSFLSAS